MCALYADSILFVIHVTNAVSKTNSPCSFESHFAAFENQGIAKAINNVFINFLRKQRDTFVASSQNDWTKEIYASFLTQHIDIAVSKGISVDVAGIALDDLQIGRSVFTLLAHFCQSQLSATLCQAHARWQVAHYNENFQRLQPISICYFDTYVQWHADSSSYARHVFVMQRWRIAFSDCHKRKHRNVYVERRKVLRELVWTASVYCILVRKTQQYVITWRELC